MSYRLVKTTSDSRRLYYKNGEGRGWKAHPSQASHYGEEDFARRDRDNLFPMEERRFIFVEKIIPTPQELEAERRARCANFLGQIQAHPGREDQLYNFILDEISREESVNDD